MGVELTDNDYVPIAGYAFQHWGERTGMPYERIRPLSDAAANRIWDRARALSVAAWSEPDDAAGGLLDLRQLDQWDRGTVREWLLARVADPAAPVVVCYQPGCAVVIDWAVLCDHWLVFFWTDACAWAMDEAWILAHDGDRFAFARKT
jgi:hypothetical protein